jgi:hypothetical protein
VAQLSQPRPRSAEELEAERIEREGLTLQIGRLRQARAAVESIAYAVQSIHYLAGEVDCTQDVQQRSNVLTGMQHSAVVVAQLCDLLAKLLQDRPTEIFGRTFTPKNEEEANHA